MFRLFSIRRIIVALLALGALGGLGAGTGGGGGGKERDIGALLTDPVVLAGGAIALVVAFFLVRWVWKMVGKAVGCLVTILVAAALLLAVVSLLGGDVDLGGIMQSLRGQQETSPSSPKSPQTQEAAPSSADQPDKPEETEPAPPPAPSGGNAGMQQPSEDNIFTSLVPEEKESAPADPVESAESPDSMAGGGNAPAPTPAPQATASQDSTSSNRAPLRQRAPSAPPPKSMKNEGDGGLLSRLSETLGGLLGGKERSEQRASTPSRPRPPQQAPVIRGKAEVINGDVLRVNGKWVRLFGIDAPDPGQQCADPSGRSYPCGQVAAARLRELVGDATLECKVREKDARGNVIASCSNGQYDIGAAMVATGWAIAYQRFSPVYVPYQEKARQSGAGLWAGTFYMPWDWRKMDQQRRDAESSVRRPRKKGFLNGILD